MREEQMGWRGKPHMPRREAISGSGAANEGETSTVKILVCHLH